MTETLAMLGAVMLASLLGSAHCVGMCGAFVAFALQPSSDRRAPSAAALLTTYHVGRLTTYLLLGVSAGAVGSLVEVGGAAVGVQRLAAITAGALMIVFGLALLASTLGARAYRFPVPKAWAALVGKATRVVAEWPPLARAGSMGFLTTWLPCGWLYLFVATAAGTGAPHTGALVMLAFWIGTLPLMSVVGVGVRLGLGPLHKRLPVATALLVVAVGALSVSGRLTPVNFARIEAGVAAQAAEGHIVPTADAEHAWLECHGD